MKAVLRIFRYEFLRQFRRRGYLFMSVGIPIIALVIFFGIRVYQQIQANNASGQPIASQPEQPSEDSPFRQIRPVGYVDLSGLLKPSPFTNLIQFRSVEEAKAALKDNQISAYYVVATDYLESGRIDMYFERFNLGNIDNSAMRMLIVQSLAQSDGKRVDQGVIALLQARKMQVTPHAIASAGSAATQKTEDTSFVLVYLFAMLLMISAFTTSGYLMQSVVEEKENRMVEVLLSSVRPRDLLGGKFLAMSLLGLFQMVLLLGTATFILVQLSNLSPALSGLTITPGQLVVQIVYFILGYMLFGAAFAAIGALVTNMREGPQMAVIVTLPAVIPFYITPIIATQPNNTLAVILSIFPLTSPLTMVMRVAVAPVPFIEVALSVALLLVTIAGVVWLAGRFFRVNALLSGQMPKLRDIVRLVRESA